MILSKTNDTGLLLFCKSRMPKVCCSAAERAHLLGCLINSAPRLIMPYIGPILKVLVHKLRVVSIPLMVHPVPSHSHLQKGAAQVGFAISPLLTTWSHDSYCCFIPGCRDLV